MDKNQLIANKIQPKLVWKYFAEICSIPHVSTHCEQIATHLAYLLKKIGAIDVYKDSTNNVIAHFKASTPTMNKKKMLGLQAHTDMVGAKDSNSKHDFSKDPIEMVRKGDFIYAKNTTLGADNGIGVAMALAIAADKKIKHGPLELIFTSDEEVGCTGAEFIKPSSLKCDYLLNLDSEDDTTLYIGCLGLNVLEIYIPVQVEVTNIKGLALSRKKLEGVVGIGKEIVSEAKRIGSWIKQSAKSLLYDKIEPIQIGISIKGGVGGHSGIAINKPISNSIKAMYRILDKVNKKFNINLVDIFGGTAFNVIPQECHASILINPEYKDEIIKDIKSEFAEIKKAYANEKDSYKVIIEDEKVSGKHLSLTSTNTIINYFNAMKVGAFVVDEATKAASSSANLGIMKFDGQHIVGTVSTRNLNTQENINLMNSYIASAKLINASTKILSQAKAWNANYDINDAAKKFYKILKTKNKNAIYSWVPGGLETALFTEGTKCKNNLISYGCNCFDVHSPNEHVQISSVQKTFKVVCDFLKTV